MDQYQLSGLNKSTLVKPAGQGQASPGDSVLTGIRTTDHIPRNTDADLRVDVLRRVLRAELGLRRAHGKYQTTTPASIGS